MASSYKKIDYRIRPAKSIERRMIVDLFRRLEEFGQLTNYRYIGLGSLYFSDFVLFHRALGFTKMISIEDATHSQIQSRFHFNVPYRHVQMKFGLSTNVLTTLDWFDRTVIWLDYDGNIDQTILNYINAVCLKAVPGSLFLISINASPPRYHDSDGGEHKNLDALKRLVDPELIPANITAGDFTGTKVADIYREVINNHIRNTLNIHNGVRSQASKVLYKQLINFHYEDGVKMLTVGGILYDEGQKSVVDRCAFDGLPFVRSEVDAYKIDPPIFTFSEIRKINSMIPLTDEDYTDLPLNKSDIDKYIPLYRYYPSFVEAEV
jgi:hypothetical protein